MRKFFVTLLAVAVFAWGAEIALYAKGSGGSSRPSGSSSSSSSRPSGSSSSRPSGTSSSRPSGTSSSPSSSRPSGTSSSPSSSRPSGTSSSPSSSRPSSPSPSTGGSSRPSSSAPSSGSSSSKPTGSFDSGANKAQSRVDSRSRYEASTKPRENYTSSNGRSVNIDSNSRSVQTIRSRVNNHDSYVNYHASYVSHYSMMPNYGYYSTLPAIYVGPGHYSHLFWYSTFNWSLTMQAMWLFHHQSMIDSKLYAERMQNAALRAEVDRLRASGIKADPNYVPTDYHGKEQLMYDPEFVSAAANMQAVRTGGSGWAFVGWFFGIIIGLLLVWFIVWLLMYKEWEVRKY